jgi:DNA-binding NarL/FixJ family response regulator
MDVSPDLATERTVEAQKTIVLYSCDLDFCVSLSMFLRDRFNFVTTSDSDMLCDLARSLQPAIIIADAVPTRRLYRTFEELKKVVPGLRILLCTTSIDEHSLMDHVISSFVDAACRKSLNAEELTERISRLV